MLDPGKTYQWRVEASSLGCTKVSSSCQTFTTAGGGAVCPAPPTPISPINNATVINTATFSWTAVEGAIDYTVFVNLTAIGTTAATSLGPVPISNGPITWSVAARLAQPCGILQSADAKSVKSPASIAGVGTND